MNALFTFVVALLAWVRADDLYGNCPAEAGPGCGEEKGSVLLQVKGGVSEGASTASRSKADEQLIEYTKLKTKLAESKDAADIMRKIDLALDNGNRAAPASLLERSSSHKKPAHAADAESLDQILESEDVLAAQGGKGMKALNVNDARKEGGRARHSAKHDISLVSTGAEKQVPLKEQGLESPDCEQSGGCTGVGKLYLKERSSEEQLKEALNTPGCEFCDDDGEKSDANQELVETEDLALLSQESENEEDDDANDEDEDTEDGAAAEPLSLLGVMDVKEADSVPLDEDGYIVLASSKSDRKMEHFVERVIDHMNLEVVEIGGLKGMVPFYSGRKATQSYEALHDELRNQARSPDSWLARKTGSWVTKSSKVRKTKPRSKKAKKSKAKKPEKSKGGKHAKRSDEDESVGLLQTGETQPEPQSMSLLSRASATATRAVHKVPDLAMALFGSRTVIMLCAVGLLGCMFLLDEKKRTNKDTNWYDPLDMSPTPPPSKADPNVEATLRDLRGKSDILK